jgi:hypothetical protein
MKRLKDFLPLAFLLLIFILVGLLTYKSETSPLVECTVVGVTDTWTDGLRGSKCTVVFETRFGKRYLTQDARVCPMYEIGSVWDVKLLYLKEP